MIELEKLPVHIPVMCDQVISILTSKPYSSSDIFIDGTFGGGGYSRALLEKTNARVIAFDKDPITLPIAQKLEEKFQGRFEFILDCFSNIKKHLTCSVQGVVYDLGVSSMQLDIPERGFSFRHDAPLDMRMDPTKGETASQALDYLNEEELTYIFKHYGEERNAQTIAKAIVKRSAIKPFITTKQLSDLVHTVQKSSRDYGRDSATRVFQALRIHVNKELEVLQKGLEAATQVLKPGGLLVVVSFHSLEDRIVKTFIDEKSGYIDSNISRHMPITLQGHKNTIRLMCDTRRAIRPYKEEIVRNPRSASARLRWAEKVEVQTGVRL